jgi:uncharacterized membrane protein
MIEAHVFNAFMRPELRSEWWFGIMNYINGLIAPAFLFVSGAVFYISTYGKTDELRQFGPSFRKKLYRIILIFLAGYSLHLPFLSLKRMVNEADTPTLMHFYAVDILQCIAAGLLIILILKLIIKNEKIFLSVIALFFIAIVSGSFLVWRMDLAEYMPLYIADYLTPRYGSLFPLLPWLAFLFAGVLFANYFIKYKNEGKEVEFIRTMFLTGTVIVIAGFILLSEWFVPENFRMLRPNPVFAVQRAGYVLIFMGLCWYYFRNRAEKKSFITEVGKESLLVYWLHLQIIYRRFAGDSSIASTVDRSFNGIESTVAWVILSSLMILAAVYWSRLKKDYPVYTNSAVRIIVWGCVIIFLLA